MKDSRSREASLRRCRSRARRIRRTRSGARGHRRVLRHRHRVTPTHTHHLPRTLHRCHDRTKTREVRTPDRALQGGASPAPCAVAYPCDESSLRGAVEAAQMGLIAADPGRARRRASRRWRAQFELDLVGLRTGRRAAQPKASAETAVRLAREGKAEMLMKGSLHTDELMAAVVQRETGLRTARRISHCFIMDVPAIDRVVIITDAAVNIFPTLEDKVHIVQNAIDLARALGVEQPKVAILSAMETVNPKVPSTIEAAALCKMAERGQITGGMLDGPLALDNAIDLGAAQIKKIASPVAGQADILVVPDLEAGNMLAKSLSFMADADAAGIVLGARVPIILASRSDSVQTRLASCAVAALVAKGAARGSAEGVGVMAGATAGRDGRTRPSSHDTNRIFDRRTPDAQRQDRTSSPARPAASAWASPARWRAQGANIVAQRLRRRRADRGAARRAGAGARRRGRCTTAPT
ncbi:MAG: bifunctional enoyl-CoA hydratase/phosphate acetyltransferase [Comamonadaceae bacterium]|nr:bifunctional enoyl-CoA hydratase/phosphate acetyltransferase [Comamonadaceae bacterium]